MCGITGFFSSITFNYDHEQVINNMLNTLRHRGPDNKGTWSSPAMGISLAHSRLSILELSNIAAQPMTSYSGRYIITFNGEIYNFMQLKNMLINKGIIINCNSDTRVLLQLIESYGLEQTLKKLTGMFAIAVWDNQDNSLYIARDRVGEKPLYYSHIKNTLTFSSELKTLKQHPKMDLKVNRDSLALLLKYNYIPAPYSIYHNTYKVPPAHYIKITKTGKNLSVSSPICYWDLPKTVHASTKNKLTLSDSELTHTLEKMLKNVITDQMLSDVPLGAFLSGGIDSSLIVSIMQSLSDKSIETFSIGFNEDLYNEAHYAKKIAKHLGTSHNELYITAKNAIETIPDLANIYDEPFADASQIPTFIVSRLARKKVAVSLSGDGADELFGGYERYSSGLNIWKNLSKIPKPIKRISNQFINNIPIKAWDNMFKMIPKQFSQKFPGRSLYRISDVLKSDDFNTLYTSLLSYWNHPEDIVFKSKHVPLYYEEYSSKYSFESLEEKMMFFDLMIYQPDDILVKLDRAAMSNSLETRVPFLNHQLIEYAFRIPVHQKIRNKQGKWILREILKRYVPETLFERPKMGFGIPLEDWLRNELKDWAGDLLDPVKINEEGYFDNKQIQDIWKSHLKGQANYQTYLWGILMFQSWLRSESAS